MYFVLQGVEICTAFSKVNRIVQLARGKCINLSKNWPNWMFCKASRVTRALATVKVNRFVLLKDPK